MDLKNYGNVLEKRSLEADCAEGLSIVRIREWLQLWIKIQEK